MILSPDRTVRDVVLELPQATRVFEKLKIDYCCGGNQRLGDACATAGVAVKNLEAMLTAADQVESQGRDSPDFQKATLSDLIGHILAKHHVYTKDEMARLEPLIDKVIAAHGANHPELLNIWELFQTLRADLTPHMFKEEQMLFPYIVELESSVLEKRPRPSAPFGTINNPIHMMMMEHDTVCDLLRELREVSSDYAVPPDVCISYQTLYQALTAFEQDLHQHIHLENNILFPRAIELEAKAVARQMTTRSFNDLLMLHLQLDECFLDHQRALLRLDLNQASILLKAYEAELLAHMRDEELLMLPLYRERATAPVGGAAEIFLGEHDKLRQYLVLFKEELTKLAAANDLERSVLFLLDSQHLFKRLLVHHDNREKKMLYPLLDEVTTQQERENLFSALEVSPFKPILGWSVVDSKK